VKGPQRGDIVVVHLRPGVGVEQQGEPRPCVVVSSGDYNALSSLLVVCPLTKQRKGRAFEVPVTFRGVEGAVLIDHVRSIDRRTRSARIVGSLDQETLAHVLAKLQALLFQ
jgi:mRNA interferase MazF